MTEPDYQNYRSIADEPHWNEFVQKTGGELVAPLIKRQGVKNADYLFRRDKVVAELKVLETEFGHTPQNLDRIKQLVACNPGVDPWNPAQPLHRQILMLLKAPLQRIVNKANRQIKETKAELGLTGWSGMLIVVNDNFRGARPGLVQGLFSHILAGTSYSSIDCFLYQTNHHVEVAEVPQPCLLWAPLYAEKARPGLEDFVNELGREWRRYHAQIEGEPDFSGELGRIDMSRTYVVDGPTRRERYVGPVSSWSAK